jgi:hypothetical protein
MKARILAISLTTAALATGAGTAALTACNPNPPDRPPLMLPATTAFTPGTCRDAADPILTLGEYTYNRAGATKLPATDYTFLIEQNNKLVTIRDNAEPTTIRDHMNAVLTAIGFVRLRPGKAYHPQLITDLETARAALQTQCVNQG